MKSQDLKQLYIETIKQAQAAADKILSRLNDTPDYMEDGEGAKLSDVMVPDSLPGLLTEDNQAYLLKATGAEICHYMKNDVLPPLLTALSSEQNETSGAHWDSILSAASAGAQIEGACRPEEWVSLESEDVISGRGNAYFLRVEPGCDYAMALVEQKSDPMTIRLYCGWLLGDKVEFASRNQPDAWQALEKSSDSIDPLMYFLSFLTPSYELREG